MSNRNRMRFASAALFASIILGTALPSWRVRAEGDTTPPSVIRITPPAPVFDETTRLAELASRRQKVAEAIGPNSMLILFSTEPRVYANDVDYQFRQENNLFYLTNLNQKRSILVMMPGNPVTPEILFLPRRDPRAETWTGRMYSAQEAAQLSGIKEIWDVNEFNSFIKGVRTREVYQLKPESIFMTGRSGPPAANGGFDALFNAAAKNQAGLYMISNFTPNGESKEYRQEQRFAATWTK